MIRKTGLTILLFCITAINAQAQLLDKTLATVRLTSTEVISEKEMTRQLTLLETQLGTALTVTQKDEVFQSSINSILINQAARRADLYATENEIQNAIAAQKAALNTPITDIEYQRLVVEQTGISWSDYRKQIEERILQEKYIIEAKPNLGQNLTQPSEQEIRAVYEQNAQNFVSPSMSGFSHIFIDLRGKADSDWNTERRKMNAYSSRIRNGGKEEFDKILKETLDDASVSGGDFGYIISGDTNAVQILGADFVGKVLFMQEEDISDVMESNVGLHIVKITDRRSPRLLGLDDPLLPGQSLTVRQQIIQYILNQKQQEALLQALEEITIALRKEAEIRVFEENIPW